MRWHGMTISSELIALAAATVLFAVTFLSLIASAQALQPLNVAASRVGASSAVLVVKTDTPSSVTVAYGSAPGVYTATASAAGGIRHELLLTGLAPSSTVYYQVTMFDAANPAGVRLPEKSFHTTRFAGEPFRYAVAGDSQPWPESPMTPPAAWQAMTTQISAENPDLLLMSGDFIYGWPTDTLAQNVSRYNSMFGVLMRLTDRVPAYTSVGNHEFIDYPNSRAGYEQEFTLPVNNGAEAGVYGEEYYSFDNGDTHFVSLCTEIPGQAGLITGAQKQWLERDLAASSATWKVVFMHRPLFSGYTYDDHWHDPNDAAGQQNKAELHNLFRQTGVDVVFEGHEHYYAHHVQDGVQYIINGGAGAKLVPPPPPGPGDAYSVSTHEHIRVDETPTSMTVTTVDASGATLETFTLTLPPQLTLAVDNTYWSCYCDYLTRRLAVDYRVVNNGYGVFDLTVVGTRATNGVIALDNGRLPLGNLEAGDSVPFTVLYFVPEQVSQFRSTSYATCHDAGGNLYSIPAAVPAG